MVRIRLATVFFVIAMLSLSIPSASADPQHSNLVARVSSDGVHVSVTLGIVQNLTGIQANMTLPQFRGILLGANASDLESSMQASIRSKVSSANINQVELQEVTYSSSAPNVQYVNLTLNFNVDGVQTSKFGVTHVDMSWKSWALSSPVALGAFEANRIGIYLVSGARQIASQPQTISIGNGAIIVRTTFAVNSKLVDATSFPTDVEAFSVLNFSQMSKPISTWTPSYDLASNSAIWSLNAGRVRYVDIYQTTVESGNATRLDYTLSYNLNAKVTAPWGSSAQEDTVISSIQGSSEGLMAGIILAAIAIGAGSFLYERRILQKKPGKRKKR